MIKWVKPNGTEIETNDEPFTIEMAHSLGWKPKQKRKRRTKAEMAAAIEAENESKQVN